MLATGDLWPPSRRRTSRSLARAAPDAAVNRWWYEQVGAAWSWSDRLVWSEQQWAAYVSRPRLQTWIAAWKDQPAGYFELDHGASETEIAYFGLLAEFIGRGLGRHLLNAAVELGWATGAKRVWVHTCTLDHPHALANYLARGFKVYRTETYPRPAAPLPPENLGVS